MNKWLKGLIAAACIAVLADSGSAEGGAIEDQLRQLEPMARDFCRSTPQHATNEDKCVGAQMIALTTLVIYKTENERVTDDTLQKCFIEIASKNAGQIDFISALSCVQR